MIYIVVPTIRKESMDRFKVEWLNLFNKHKVTLVEIIDGTVPGIDVYNYKTETRELFTFKKTKAEFDNVFYNFNDGVRNLGFYYVAMVGKKGDVIITLDDDCYPCASDPIQEHLDILGNKVPTSWVSTADEYMRGFPYAAREESEVMASHGVWLNVPDLDAPTQLVKGVRLSGYNFNRMIIPKGIYFPMCIMNVAFNYEVLPYMYQAPAGKNCPHGIDRFADIWAGINMVRYAEKYNFAIATGYSTIWHDRASNVFKNLQKEAKGIELNETYWQGDEKDPYFKLYNERRLLWEKTIKYLCEK